MTLEFLFKKQTPLFRVTFLIVQSSQGQYLPLGKMSGFLPLTIQQLGIWWSPTALLFQASKNKKQVLALNFPSLPWDQVVFFATTPTPQHHHRHGELWPLLLHYTREHFWVCFLGTIQPGFCPWTQSRDSSSLSRDTLSPRQSFWGITLIKVLPAPILPGVKGWVADIRKEPITQVHNSKMPFRKGFSRDNSEPKSRNGLLFAIIVKAIKILNFVI